LILILACFVFQTSEPPAVITLPRTALMRSAAPPAQQTISLPGPAAQALLRETMDTPMTPDQEAPAILDDTSNPELPFTSVPDDSSLGDDSILVRYLDRLTGEGCNFPFLREPSPGSGGVFAFGRLQAGYGRIFTDDSVITRRRNGTAREDQSWFYLKTSFRF
jgi:hypothetical protein